MTPKLKQAILLGTERRPVEISDFPAPVADALQHSDDTRVEAALLSGLALMQARDAAARQPQLAASAVSPFLMTDNIAPTVFGELLTRIFKRPDLFAPLAALLFEKMHQHDITVPPEWLTSVLNAGTTRKFSAYRHLIKLVVGERGKWLAQFQPTWSYVLRENAQANQALAELPAPPRKQTQRTASPTVTSEIQQEKEALSKLSDREVEQYFMAQRTSGNPYFLTDALIRPGIRWSPAFTHHMLEAMSVEDFIHHHADAPLRLAMQYDPMAITILQEWLSLTPRNWTDQQLHKKVLSPLLDFLMLRADIDAITV